MQTYSFRELSALGSLLAIVVAYGMYFTRIFGLIAGGTIPPGSEVFAYGLSIVGVLVAIEIGYHILLAIRFRDEPADERDRMISRRAHSYAYGVLITGAVLVIGYLLLNESPIIASQVLLLAVVLAEVVNYATTFVLYRLSI